MCNVSIKLRFCTWNKISPTSPLSRRLIVETGSQFPIFVKVCSI